MAKTCLDSIPTLTALASKQGFLEEKHFADAGLWQTEEEKEAEEKNPRDDLALFFYRQRAILLTSAGFRARTEARRKELDEPAGKRGQKEGRKRTGGAEEVFEKSEEGVEM